jgi:formate-nitrite transporter family protein
MVKQLAEEVGDDVTIVYRHFPLTSIHPNAEPAARAAEAAALQGKFWDMHDMLFEKQRFWSEERDPKQLFVRYASDLGLNTEQFESDISTGAVRDKVDNDRRSGARAAVNGTPTFFLNGQRLDNPRSYDELRTAILGQ